MHPGKTIVYVVLALVVLLGLAIGLLPYSGWLDDAPAASAPSPSTPTITVEADPAPSFEPGALRQLIEKKQSDGMDATVTAYIRWLAANAKRLRQMSDYSMTLIKTERINGRVYPTTKSTVKVRNQPFSVYMSFSEPKGLKGQEAIYVEGKNEGRIVGHTGGILSLVGTLRILPTSPRAMDGNRHPITDLGMSHMMEEAIQNVPVDQERGYTTFDFKLGEMIDGKPCTCFIITRQRKEPTDHNPPFQSDKMYFDDELLLPIFYQCYEWPEKEGDPPVLAEEYKHVDVRLNNGFTDVDFDEKNPAYHY
ncbi:DUF1571 domain-containing protein [bacterium]|jgi:hypothetical protein|nr:DUF1571 domain-containing protein [bacterium]